MVSKMIVSEKKSRAQAGVNAVSGGVIAHAALQPPLEPRKFLRMFFEANDSSLLLVLSVSLG